MEGRLGGEWSDSPLERGEAERFALDASSRLRCARSAILRRVKRGEGMEWSRKKEGARATISLSHGAMNDWAF